MPRPCWPLQVANPNVPLRYDWLPPIDLLSADERGALRQLGSEWIAGASYKPTFWDVLLLSEAAFKGSFLFFVKSHLLGWRNGVIHDFSTSITLRQRGKQRLLGFITEPHTLDAMIRELQSLSRAPAWVKGGRASFDASVLRPGSWLPARAVSMWDGSLGRMLNLGVEFNDRHSMLWRAYRPSDVEFADRLEELAQFHAEGSLDGPPPPDARAANPGRAAGRRGSGGVSEHPPVSEPLGMVY